jgi:hypothetical protein
VEVALRAAVQCLDKVFAPDDLAAAVALYPQAFSADMPLFVTDLRDFLG